MKTVNRTQHPSKGKQEPFEKTELTTGVNSRQRSHAASVNRPKTSKEDAKDSSNRTVEIPSAKTQQLFTIIQTFYNTLCNLPLQKLISSSYPQNWIGEQQQTLLDLKSKLEKTPKSKEQQYYRWKLQSMQTILGNISNNMSMLNRITQLRNYCSTDSSNYRSRGGSSSASQPREIRLGDFASSDSSQVKEMLSYDQYVIHPVRTEQGNKRSPQIMAETINSDEEDSEEETMAKSEVVKSVAKRERVAPKMGENRNLINMKKVKMQKESELMASSKVIKNDMKDKTLAKIQGSKNGSSQRTLSNYLVENRFLQDRLINPTNQQTKRSEDMPSWEMSKSGGPLSADSSPNSQPSPKQPKDSEYIELIKQLRLELMNKDAQIERLLISEQSYEETVEMIGAREKELNTEILFLKETLNMNSKEKEKLQTEIRKMQQHEEELKETIRFQRERNKKEEVAKEKMEEKFYQEVRGKEEMTDEINRLAEENKIARRSERVMKEKLQIYTKKYYNLYGELEQAKEDNRILLVEIEKMRNSRVKSQSRYEEIQEIVQFHKERLCDDEEI